jgi:hypothetical protein
MHSLEAEIGGYEAFVTGWQPDYGTIVANSTEQAGNPGAGIWLPNRGVWYGGGRRRRSLGLPGESPDKCFLGQRHAPKYSNLSQGNVANRQQYKGLRATEQVTWVMELRGLPR